MADKKKGGVKAFIGNYEVNVLSGFRIVFPARFRNLLGSQIVLTKGIDSNLYVFEISRWQTLIAPLTSRSMLNRNVRAMLRYLVAHAFLLDLDSQGRVVIPNSLRELGNKTLEVGDKLVVAGLYNWIEIWRKDDWNNAMERLKRDVVDIADLLDNQGLGE